MNICTYLISLCHKSFIHQNILPYTEYGVSVCMYSKLKWLLDHIGHQANLHLVYMYLYTCMYCNGGTLEGIILANIPTVVKLSMVIN